MNCGGNIARRAAHHAKWLLLLVVLLGSTGAEPGRARSEAEIKAVFIFNFLQFVEWPKDVMERTEGEYRIGLVGEDPFDGLLDRIVAGERLNNRAIKVIPFEERDPGLFCHVFFISRGEAGRLPTLQRKFRGNPALTVSDIPGFADRGGMVELVKRENKIQLRINLEAVKAENITISSRLLRLAEVVGEAKSD